ncbi:MAG: hypothetical protein JSV05_03200, partial [Candidatus Bathyarchaeota archaeon]
MVKNPSRLLRARINLHVADSATKIRKEKGFCKVPQESAKTFQQTTEEDFRQTPKPTPCKN